MTLDELLALLPDNTAGEISAADMRTIVTSLYEDAHALFTQFAYKWTTSATPASGRVNMDQPWQTFATKLLISDTADDGTAPSFTLLDSAPAAKGTLSTVDGSKLAFTITGPSAALTGYHEVPISVQSIVGTAPSNGEGVTVTTIAVVP